jgi:hypothetical protein
MQNNYMIKAVFPGFILLSLSTQAQRAELQVINLLNDHQDITGHS